MMRLALALVLVTAPLGATLSARSPGDISEIRNGLLAVAVGNEIQEKCASISPRLIRVYSLRNQLLAVARSEGFSDDEIDAYVDDETARARLEADADAYLRQNGVVEGNVDTYCALGRTEIAAGSAVGRLLRER
ncbi:MAG: DUF5333 domain-containing protein [Pseudomonadota bacterium]